MNEGTIITGGNQTVPLGTWNLASSSSDRGVIAIKGNAGSAAASFNGATITPQFSLDNGVSWWDFYKDVLNPLTSVVQFAVADVDPTKQTASFPFILPATDATEEKKPKLRAVVTGSGGTTNVTLIIANNG